MFTNFFVNPRRGCTALRHDVDDESVLERSAQRTPAAPLGAPGAHRMMSPLAHHDHLLGRNNHFHPSSGLPAQQAVKEECNYSLKAGRETRLWTGGEWVRGGGGGEIVGHYVEAYCPTNNQPQVGYFRATSERMSFERGSSWISWPAGSLERLRWRSPTGSGCR